MNAIELANFLTAHAKKATTRFTCNESPFTRAAAELRRLAAVEAELVALREQEPVAWQSNFIGENDWGACTKEHAEWVGRVPQEFVGYQTRALYAQPVPQTQETLDKPARVRGVVFGTGVKVMTVIQAAQRCAEEYVPEDAPGIRKEILRGLQNVARPTAIELQDAEIGIPEPVTGLINPA